MSNDVWLLHKHGNNPLTMNKKMLLKIPRSILLITTRRIGDVLLTTPLISSLRNSFKDAKIDILVFKGTEGCIAANKEIDNIISIVEGDIITEQIKMICRLFQKYDLAITTLPGDRPVFYARIAGKKSIGLLESGYKNLWKRLLLDYYELFDNWETHTVMMNLSLLKSLHIRPIVKVTASWTTDDEAMVESLLPFNMEKTPYAVLHVFPKFSYKMWRLDGWQDLIRWISEKKGLEIVLTGSNSQDELEYIAHLRESLSEKNITNTAGRISLGGIAYLLRNASFYVGPDTSITHMAAALGTQTIALYGPSNPVKWGPMPNLMSYAGKSPFKRKGNQQLQNVTLLQGKADCVPCYEEGCDRHVHSFSKCLQDISLGDVIQALNTIV